jgi:hypothetical protein
MGANGIIWDSPGLMGNLGRMMLYCPKGDVPLPPVPYINPHTGQTEAERFMWSSDEAD